MLVDHVGIVTGVGYNIGHVFVSPWKTSTKIAPFIWGKGFVHKLVLMYKLQRLTFWAMERFVKSLIWTTITLGLLITVPHHLSVLQYLDCHEDYMLILCPPRWDICKAVMGGKSFVQTKICNFQPSFSTYSRGVLSTDGTEWGCDSSLHKLGYKPQLLVEGGFWAQSILNRYIFHIHSMETMEKS